MIWFKLMRRGSVWNTPHAIQVSRSFRGTGHFYCSRSFLDIFTSSLLHSTNFYTGRKKNHIRKLEITSQGSQWDPISKVDQIAAFCGIFRNFVKFSCRYCTCSVRVSLIPHSAGCRPHCAGCAIQTRTVRVLII